MRELEVKQLIQSYNFDFIVNSLRASKKDWSLSAINEAVQQYKNFLLLKWKYGNSYELPPSVDIDEVWHTHILHTKHYAEFCEKVFGTFLHHTPSLERNEMVMTKMQQLFEQQTQKLYEKEFGESIYSVKQNFLQRLLSRVSFLGKTKNEKREISR